MARMNQMFPSNWLAAGDLEGEKKTFTITNVTQELLEGRDGEDDKMKWTVHFSEGKPLILNVTNAKSIASIYGDDTDDWIDQVLVLYPTKVNFKGQSTNAIRVHEDATKALLRKALKATTANGKNTVTSKAKANAEAQEDYQRGNDVPF